MREPFNSVFILRVMPRGSTIKDLRSIVEGAIYDLAPDLMSLTILAPEEESSSGFVPLQSLLKHSAAVHSARRGWCRLRLRCGLAERG